MNRKLLIAIPLLCLFLGAGVSLAALGDNWAVGPDDDIRMKATASTGKTSDIDITVPATNVVNVKTGNLKVGDATPGVTLNGEDAYIEGTLEVVGNLTATVERSIKLDVANAVAEGEVLGTLVRSDTVPALAAKKDVTAYLKWLDGHTSKAQKKFVVPADYSSGGAFRFLVGKSGVDGNPPAIDFEVFIDQDNTAFDASATDQTASTLSGSNGDGSPEQKELSVTTDFASLAAQDYVTLNFWRDDTGTSTQELEVYYAEFYYTARQ